MRHIEAAREGRSWAVEHDNGNPGMVPTKEEAEAVAFLLQAARDEGSDLDDMHMADLLGEWLSWPRLRGA